MSDEKPYRWAIIACSASKLNRRAPARELYTGQLFCLSLAVAEQLATDVVVLSARHGVVPLDRELEPYDAALGDMLKHQLAIWGASVAKELALRFGIADSSDMEASRIVGERVLCLAPGSYLDAIGFNYWQRSASKPLKGLGIGQQKKRLAEMLSASKDAQMSKSWFEEVLRLEADCPGAHDASFEVPADVWRRIVAAAKEAKCA